MQSAPRPDGSALPEHSRTSSMASETPPTPASPATPSMLSVQAATYGRPAGYVAESAAAAHILTQQKSRIAEENMVQQVQTRARLIPVPSISSGSLLLINSFLDHIVYQVLETSHSTALTALRPAVHQVLKGKLARQAIQAADEELDDLLGNDQDDQELELIRTASDRQSKWDVDAIFRRVRVKVMGYMSLGEVDDDEEEDEEEEEKEVEDEPSLKEDASESGLVSWAAAIFMTSILEHIAEQCLNAAGKAAYDRASSRIDRKLDLVENEGGTPNEHVLVTEQDTDRIALSATLGRLWRTWRKAVRSGRVRSSGTSTQNTSRKPSISLRHSNFNSNTAAVANSQSAAIVEQITTQIIPEHEPTAVQNVELPSCPDIATQPAAVAEEEEAAHVGSDENARGVSEADIDTDPSSSENLGADFDDPSNELHATQSVSDEYRDSIPRSSGRRPQSLLLFPTPFQKYATPEVSPYQPPDIQELKRNAKRRKYMSLPDPYKHNFPIAELEALGNLEDAGNAALEARKSRHPARSVRGAGSSAASLKSPTATTFATAMGATASPYEISPEQTPPITPIEDEDEYAARGWKSHPESDPQLPLGEDGNEADDYLAAITNKRAAIAEHGSLRKIDPLPEKDGIPSPPQKTTALPRSSEPDSSRVSSSRGSRTNTSRSSPVESRSSSTDLFRMDTGASPLGLANHGHDHLGINAAPQFSTVQNAQLKIQIADDFLPPNVPFHDSQRLAQNSPTTASGVTPSPSRNAPRSSPVTPSPTSFGVVSSYNPNRPEDDGNMSRPPRIEDRHKPSLEVVPEDPAVRISRPTFSGFHSTRPSVDQPIGFAKQSTIGQMVDMLSEPTYQDTSEASLVPLAQSDNGDNSGQPVDATPQKFGAISASRSPPFPSPKRSIETPPASNKGKTRRPQGSQSSSVSDTSSVRKGPRDWNSGSASPMLDDRASVKRVSGDSARQSSSQARNGAVDSLIASRKCPHSSEEPCHCKVADKRGTEMEKAFADLIATEETKKFTLTPRTLVEIEQPDSPRYKTQFDLTSQAGSEVAESNPITIDSTIMQNSAALDSVPESPEHVIRPALDSRPSTGRSSRSRSGFVARDASPRVESVQDFVNFIRATAPDVSRPEGVPAHALPHQSSARGFSLQSNKQLPTPIIPPSSQDTTTPSTRNPSMDGPYSPVSPTVRPRVAIRPLQPREASFRDGYDEELLDFFRQGPPTLKGTGPARIDRSVDSGDVATVSSAKHASSVYSGSAQASLHSNTALVSGSSASSQPRKQRRIRDPYQIDFSDDEDEEFFASRIRKTEEESLADFLKNVTPPDSSPLPPQTPPGLGPTSPRRPATSHTVTGTIRSLPSRPYTPRDGSGGSNFAYQKAVTAQALTGSEGAISSATAYSPAVTTKKPAAKRSFWRKITS